MTDNIHELQRIVSEQSQRIEVLTKENERLQNIFDNMRGWPEEPDVMPFHEHLKETSELNLKIKALTEQVENLKEKVLTLDKVLKKNHDQAQQQWEQDQAELSRLREREKELVEALRKCKHEIYRYSPDGGALYMQIESLLSKFEVPNKK